MVRSTNYNRRRLFLGNSTSRSPTTYKSLGTIDNPLFALTAHRTSMLGPRADKKLPSRVKAKLPGCVTSVRQCNQWHLIRMDGRLSLRESVFFLHFFAERKATMFHINI